MKIIFAAILFILTFAFASFAQEACTRVVETAGGFSYCQPAGWTAREEAGSKYKTVYAPPVPNTFEPTINVYEIASTDSLDVFVDAAVKSMIANAKDTGATSMTQVSREAFVTDSKEAGVKVVLRSDYKGMIVISCQYVFNMPKAKLMFIGSTLESARAANEKLYDASAKSLQFVK